MQSTHQQIPIFHLSIRIGTTVVALPMYSSDTDNSLIDRLLSMKEYRSVCTHKEQYQEQYRTNIKSKIMSKLRSLCESGTNKGAAKEDLKKFVSKFLELCDMEVGVRENQIVQSQIIEGKINTNNKLCKRDTSQVSISLGKKQISKQTKYKTQPKKAVNTQPTLKSKTSKKSITKLSKLKNKIFNSKEEHSLRIKTKKQEHINNKNKENANTSLTQVRRHKKMESESKILQRIQNKICNYEKINKIYFNKQFNGPGKTGRRKQSNISNFTQQMEQFGINKSKQFDGANENSIVAIQSIAKGDSPCFQVKNGFINNELKNINKNNSILKQNSTLNMTKINEDLQRQSDENSSKIHISQSRRNSYNYSANQFGEYIQPQSFDGLRRNYNYHKQSQHKLAYFQEGQPTDQKQNRYNYLQQALNPVSKPKQKATGPTLLHPYPIQVTSTSTEKNTTQNPESTSTRNDIKLQQTTKKYENFQYLQNNYVNPQKSARRNSHDFDFGRSGFGNLRKYEEKGRIQRNQRRSFCEGKNSEACIQKGERQLEDRYGRNGGLKFKYF